MRDGRSPALIQEVEQLRSTMLDLIAANPSAAAQALGMPCTCGSSPTTYEGPEPDCAVHGAVQALNKAHAEIERLTPPLGWSIAGDGYSADPGLWRDYEDEEHGRCLLRRDRASAEVWDWLTRVIPAWKEPTDA